MTSYRLDSLAEQYLEDRDGQYACTVCGKLMDRRYTAKLHLESKHFPTDNGYQCDLCDKTFNTYSAIKNHKFTYHQH